MSMDSSQPPKSGGMSTVMMVLLVLLGGGALVCCGACGLGGFRLYQTGNKLVKDQTNASQQLEPARLVALKAIQQNAEAKALLGDNIQLASNSPLIYIGLGEVDTSNATFVFGVTGGNPPKAGNATCVASQVEGNWQVTEISLNVDDESISIDPLTGATPELKFDTGDEKMPDEN